MELASIRSKLYSYNIFIFIFLPKNFSKFELINSEVSYNKMSDILRNIIYEQNRELLTRIANDHFETDKEKETFMKEFHKKNFAYLNICKRSKTEDYKRKVNKLVVALDN